MIGKVPPDLLSKLVLGRTGAPDARVVQGPAYGEDAAAIEFGDELLVVNTDPISLAVDRVGTLGVSIACNDVAASGASPEWLTSVVFLPDESAAVLDELTRQLDAEARRLDVAIVGGHSEYDPARSSPLLVLTCLGTTDRFVPTGGAEPGDRILLTKSAAVEATAILATDFRDLVAEQVSAAVVERGAAFYDDVSVVEEAAIVASHANAMHDPTEGGLVDGFFEMAAASDVVLDVDPSAIPIREETAQLCAAAGVDPLRTFGSGALIAAIPEEAVDAVADDLRSAGVPHAFVGTASEAGDTASEAGDAQETRLILGDDRYTEPVRDDMYALWE